MALLGKNFNRKIDLILFWSQLPVLMDSSGICGMLNRSPYFKL